MLKLAHYSKMKLFVESVWPLGNYWKMGFKTEYVSDDHFILRNKSFGEFGIVVDFET